MNPLNHTALAEQYRRLRAELLTEHPDIDERTLADSLEGETDLQDTVVRFIVQSLEDKCTAEALNDRLKDMTERRNRISSRSDKRRAIALALMTAAGLRKLEQPDFTASLRSTPPKVIVTDEDALPDAFVKLTRTPDKLALREALARGDYVNGASLSNGSETLAILTK